MLTNCMELSPSGGAARCAATQELPSNISNPKVYYRVHNSPSLVFILSQIDPVYMTLSFPSKIHFNIIHPPISFLMLMLRIMLRDRVLNEKEIYFKLRLR
jgi:hypothetical protein